MKKNSVLIKPIEDKAFVWFKNSNQYSIFDPFLADIIEHIDQDTPLEIVTQHIQNETGLSVEKVHEVIDELTQLITTTLPVDDHSQSTFEIPEATFYKTYYYTINNATFCFHYGSEYVMNEIHLKFAHLVTKKVKEPNHTITILESDNTFSLQVDEIFNNNYTEDNFHYLQGKLSMYIMMLAYKKPEREWLGVFHASAISYNGKSAMLLGDSGNGKSTALAIAHANGFNCIADDFVPMGSALQNIYPFPAAISVKEKSLPVLANYYPDIMEKPSFKNRLGKTVTFIPTDSHITITYPCHNLIFIKYKAGSNLQVAPITKTDAFQQLVPDSWLSPEPENAEIFLNWFNTVKTYQLTYSKTEDLLATLKDILDGNH
ncbi:phosphoenolpyruvate carboxykinase (ATP) [Neptunitalea lumnitzerae]|uniref:Uncharacterized protein n=1 Tax=Neptunitalea lumnitzerae TaxID=2965509 RepID=A0ABQ5MMM3_9FLAO|nr:hypothetical protein [Neptunitalea sp. Y10]GLB50345.1 hypothetical protein Y10_27130 [Neptunitalea sp. Y10]